jgi:hypothetical protein
MSMNFLAKNGKDYIIERIYYDKAISVEETRKIFLSGLGDFFLGNMDEKFISDISGELYNQFSDFEDILNSDSELHGFLHDTLELCDLSDEKKKILIPALKEYLEKHS